MQTLKHINLISISMLPNPVQLYWPVVCIAYGCTVPMFNSFLKIEKAIDYFMSSGKSTTVYFQGRLEYQL